jgi:hypothetical protein
MEKLLKSPHSTHRVFGGLTVVVLDAIDEALVQCTVRTVLGGTPIVVAEKTANHAFLQVQLIKFII